MVPRSLTSGLGPKTGFRALAATDPQIARTRPGLDHPRSPYATTLSERARPHAKELREAGRLPSAVEKQVVERFIVTPTHAAALLACLLARLSARVFLQDASL